MSSNNERVFVVGASGNIGSEVVRGLIKKEIDTTAYVRDESKAKDLFKEELLTGHLTIVVGTYASIDVFKRAIQGHTRLFILAVGDVKKPASMSQIKQSFGKIAFEHGVRQIVDVSSFGVRICGKQVIIGYMHTTAEEKLWALADEDPEQRSLVVLRPAAFMNNHLKGDIHHIKRSNKITSCAPSSSTMTWIDTKDIADCAVVILTEPVEKHDRCVYEMGAEILSNEQRAAIFTKVLGKSITYEQQSIEDFYNTLTGHGVAHSLVYNMSSYALFSTNQVTTPQLSVLIKRPLRTLEEWVNDNAKVFQ